MRWGGEEDEEFARKGTAVRLETFSGGRYYEPYFVVFARRLPDLDDPVPLSSQPLFIAHHTVPHWIPLEHLARRYLGILLDEQVDAAAREHEGFRCGEPDLELFLTRLSPNLNAFVSRREQLVALTPPILHRRNLSSTSDYSRPSRIAFHDLCVERFEEPAGREEVSLLVPASRRMQTEVHQCRRY
ncbi:hypothetical protein JCM3770_006834 [Rhodotorula araucariae]